MKLEEVKALDPKSKNVPLLLEQDGKLTIRIPSGFVTDKSWWPCVLVSKFSELMDAKVDIYCSDHIFNYDLPGDTERTWLGMVLSLSEKNVWKPVLRQ